MKRDVKKFLEPKSIAVVGASNNQQKVGYTLFKKLLSFKGQVFPVNILEQEVLGRKAYSSILSIKSKIDLVVIAIPSKSVISVLEDCGKKKIRNIIIISAGFSEVGNDFLDKEMKQLAKKYKLNILGPNCFGIANPYLDLDTTFSNLPTKRGDIAFISQSGALWSYISDISNLKQANGFSGFVSLGNIFDLNFNDFIQYFNKDKKTKKIVLYIEKIKDGKKFIEICKKSKKEIIAIKAGRTEIGTKATLSHTGSLATSFEVYRGIFKQAHVKLASSFAEAFNLVPQQIKVKGKRIAILTNAGGAGALLADQLVEKGYSPFQPIDILGTALAKDYGKELLKLKNRKDVDSIIVLLTPQSMSQPLDTAKEIVKYSKTSNKIITAVFLGANSIIDAKRELEKNKIPCINII